MRHALAVTIGLVGCASKATPEPVQPGDSDLTSDTDAPDTDRPADTDVPGPASLSINELLADNGGSYRVGDAAPDWVELYNGGEVAVDLRGFFLSDDPQDPRRHRFERSVVVPARGFVLLLADGEVAAGADHLSFALSSSGEDVVLTDPQGRRLDWVSYAVQDTDVAVARAVDGSEEEGWVYVFAGSPGASNAP